jgi:outer membrane protein TolC
VLEESPERPRSDLSSSLESVARAGDDVRRARAARLPTLEAFARVATHAPDLLGGREADVTVGVQVSVPLFMGGALASRADEARALERAARLEHDHRVLAARAQLREALRAVDAAARGARAADLARVAADEAHRLVRRRYQEGMATTVELLQAEARAAEYRTLSVDARVGYHQALAALTFVRGGDGPLLPPDASHE